MPNWCSNEVKVYFDSSNEEALRDALENDQELFQQFHPRPAEYDADEKWYWWNVENWGTKWDTKPYDVEWEDEFVTFKLETAWGPPIGFYEKMDDLGFSVEAWYLEEGMAFCGHYSDGYDDHYEYGDMSADQMEEELPEWAEEIFGLVTRKRDDEEQEEDEEENEYIPALYNEDQKTDWFSVKVKPQHNGMYEVKTKEWPFPHVMDWNGDYWCMAYTNSKAQSKVTDWRGLKENV